MTKHNSSSKPITNRRARFDYELGEKIVAGIVLSGREVRGARLGHVRIVGSFATLRDDGLWLTNMSITLPDSTLRPGDDKESTLARKLLVTKSQLEKLRAARVQGMTIVPTRLLNNGRYIKIELSIAKGKKLHDKRETIKQRDQAREIKRTLKQHI